MGIDYSLKVSASSCKCEYDFASKIEASIEAKFFLEDVSVDI